MPDHSHSRPDPKDRLESTVPADRSSRHDFIGPYRILQKLGEGGMGEVFEAQQDEPVRRRVAVKVIKRGMETKQVLARFEAERQALALMDHACVARVFDAGETDRGRPYFAMEFVQGVPITEHCDRHRLTTAQRLELFIQVCEGIQHAHHKAVIHRDIKPSNVLVSLQDGKAIPKIIDFGVAKAIAQPLTDRTVFTEMGQLIGTPAYMSPEQAEMTGQNIDTRSDVYSLGAMLYELLVGAAPFDSKRLRADGLDGIRKMIREVEPPKPSTRASRAGGASAASAQNRRTAPRGLAGQLRGDLDWITMKALEKDRMRRYQSPNDLARDIQRYLKNEPVEAGPPSQTYRFRKLVIRHKATSALLSAIFLVLVGFGTWMSILYGREEALRAEAQARADELEVVTEFQASMLSEIDAQAMGRSMIEDLRAEVEQSLQESLADPSEVTANLETFDRILGEANATNVALGIFDEQVLTRASTAIAAEFGDQPQVRAALQQSLSITYKNLGLFPQALPLLREAVATFREELGTDHTNTLSAINSLSRLLWRMGDLDEAYPYSVEAMEGYRRTLGPDHRRTVVAIATTGVLLKWMGRMEESLEYQQQALDISRRVNGDDHAETIVSLGNVGVLLDTMGRHEEALPYLEEALAGRRKVYGEDHPTTLLGIANLSLPLMNLGRFEEALASRQEVLEARRRVLGDDHPQTFLSMVAVGVTLNELNRSEEALEYFDGALQGQRKVLGEEHPLTLGTLSSMGVTLIALGRLDEALSYARRAAEGRQRVLGEDHQLTLLSTVHVGSALRELGRPLETVALLTGVEASARQAFTGGNARRLALFLTELGQARAATGDFVSAQAHLDEAQTVLNDAANPRTKDLTSLHRSFERLYTAWHQASPAEGHDRTAAQWRAKVQESEAQKRDF